MLDEYFFSGNISITTNTLTIFAVAFVSESSEDTQFGRLLSLGFYSTRDYTDVNYISIARNKNSGFSLWRDNKYIDNNPPSFNTPYLYGYWCDGTNMNQITHIGNNTSITSNTSTGTFNISKYCIGQNVYQEYRRNVAALGGYVSEILVFNKLLNIDDRQKIEGYLSWKWGLHTNLSNDHPYKNVRI